MQKIEYKPLSTVWLKAAVMGSLWASFEIIAGSFLHNLRIPFSGTTLTFASVFLVIAFIQLWDDKGLVWRAGLICALMKSISPSAVIIGPMVGILTEAFIIEFFLRTTGRNLISYMLAGSLAVASALIHKIISLLILYGFDLVKILEGIYLFAVRQLRFIKLEPLQLLILLLAIYLIAGVIAAILGYITGRNILKKQRIPLVYDRIQLSSSSHHFNINSHKRYSPFLLLIHLAIITVSLWMINSGRFYIFLPLSITYILSCFFWYRKSLRYLRKINFWIYFIIITLAAAFLLEGYSSGNYFSAEGLLIGLKMNLRAFVIMVGFTAISTELKNPLIRSVLYNRGFASVYQSLSLAFSALPGILAGMPGKKEFYRKRTSMLSYLFHHSQHLLDQFKDSHYKRPVVFILTGNPGQGKTTFLRKVTRNLTEKGVKVDGFFSEGVQENDERIGFDLIAIPTSDRMIISRKKPGENWKKQGHYYFDMEVFQKGSELILKKLENNIQLIIIDEIGPLEMNDNGWSPLIVKLCTESEIPMLWVVRRSLVQRAACKWNVGDVYVFDLGKDNEEDLMDAIIRITAK